MSPVKSAVIVDSSWGLAAPKDERTVHVTCGVCQNRMPNENLAGHMAKKHADTDDQVDAIGTKLSGMSMACREKPHSTTQIGQDSYGKSSIREFLSDQSKQTVFPSIKQEPFAAPTPNPTNIGPVFYTIRVSESQMQQLLEQNRVFPKDGFLHLK